MASEVVHALPAMSFLAPFWSVAFRGVWAYIYGYGCENCETPQSIQKLDVTDAADAVDTDFTGPSTPKIYAGGDSPRLR
jgi:hypothetical protein